LSSYSPWSSAPAAMAGVALVSVPLDLRCLGSGTSSRSSRGCPGRGGGRGSVAAVGAVRGELTVALAADVGPSGLVFSTDVDTHALEQIRARVAAAALRNVTVVQAHARDTGLPTSCCDAMVPPRVYSHLNAPRGTQIHLLRAP